MPTKTEYTIDIKQPPSVFLEQFRHLQAVDEKSAAGAYRTIILGSPLAKLASKVILPLIGFRNWKGKRLLGNGKGINIFKRDGQYVDDILMLTAVGESWLDGKPALILTYPPGAPFFTRYLRDELRQLDDNTLIILGWFDLPFVRNSASAALLVKGMKE
jgi:hypothetical protein